MKTLLVVLGVVGVGLFLLAKSGNFSFYAYRVSQGADSRSHVHCLTGCDTDIVQNAMAAAGGTPTLEDAVALVAVDQSPTYGRAVFGMLRLLNRAGHMARAAGSALVWQKAPPLAQTMESEESLLLDRLHAVVLQTSAGELCRQAALRLVARHRGAVVEFENALGQNEPSWNAVRSFNAARREAGRAYVDEVRPCIAAASGHDRPQLARIISRF